MKEPNLTELELVLLTFMGVFLLLCLSIIFFIILYSRKQRQNKVEKELLKKSFESEKLSAQLEIAEQTMQELSQELHDNIGQRISLAVQGFRKDFGEDHMLNDLLKETLEDLRLMSKSMNGSHLEKVGIDMAIERECKRIHDSTNFSCVYAPTEDYLALSADQEVILFRCFQELVNNSLKHSHGNEINVRLRRVEDEVILEVQDNGKGFDIAVEKNGVGMLSLENRVKLLRGNLDMDSKFEKGTRTEIRIPTKSNFADD